MILLGHCLQGWASGKAFSLGGNWQYAWVWYTEAHGQVGVNLSPLPFTCLPDLVYTLVSLSFSDSPFKNGNNVYPVGSS